MKKWIVFVMSLLFCLSASQEVNAQLGGLMNKVKNRIVEKALGTDQGSAAEQNAAVGKEPDCASEDARVVFEFDKGFKIAMNEISICIQDGDILFFSKVDKKYFIRKMGSDSPEGPYVADDPAVTRFVCNDSGSENSSDFSVKYPELITRSGEKYLIRFGGKSYGPYAVIQDFTVSSEKTKFVARVIPELMFTEQEGAQMDKEAKEAKTMEQQMELSKKIQEKMMQKATKVNPLDMQMKLISNVQGFAEGLVMAGILSSTIKYDEIVWVTNGKIMDLAGKTIFTYDPLEINPSDGLWLSSDNKKYAMALPGILKMSDGQECSDVFSPFILKENGNITLNYLYFSPGEECHYADFPAFLMPR